MPGRTQPIATCHEVIWCRVGGLVEEAVLRLWLAGIFVLTVGALLLIAGADLPVSALAENIVWST